MNHICFLTSAFGREDSLMVIRQGISLVQAGYKVSYLLCDGQPREMRYGIEMISVAQQGNKTKERAKKDPAAIKQYIVEKEYTADVFQISELILIPLGLWLKKKGFKVVFNLREYYPEYYALRFKNKILHNCVLLLLEWYFRYAMKRFDGLFNCMPEMSDYIRKVMPCRYFEDVANYPIVNKNFSVSYDDYCKRENIISYFGTIYDISCQEEFLDAIATIPNVRYLLAGVMSDGYKAKLVSKEGWKKVTFKNGFTREELPGIINCSVIGNVMKDFNQTETPQGSFSIIKIFESMEAAIPVILSKVPLYENMVERYNCGICCDPHNVEEIRNAVQYLLNHKKEAYEMGQNGRNAVLSEYSWDIDSKKYIRVFDELLST